MHPRNNGHPYGFIPIPVPWYALSGLGYQQHQFPTNNPHPPSADFFFASDQPGSNMSANWADSSTAASPEQQQQQQQEEEEEEGASSSSEGQNGVTVVGNNGPESQQANDEGVAATHNAGGTVIQRMNRAVLLEPQTDHVLRFLSRQLKDAIALCESYVQEYEDNIEGVRLYLDIASRDRLWAGLLESKFKDDEGSRHLLRSLPFDVDAAVRRALQAACKEREQIKTKLDAASSSSADQQDNLDRYEKRAHEIEILRLRCGRVTKLAKVALGHLGMCKKLLEEMALMHQTIEAMCPTKTDP